MGRKKDPLLRKQDYPFSTFLFFSNDFLTELMEEINQDELFTDIRMNTIFDF